MSLMERVREIGAAENEVSEQTVAVARRTLMNEVTRATRPAHARRRRHAWAGVGIGGLVAGTAVTAIVVGSVIAPPATSSASAAEALNAAAKATLSATVLDPAPGQYLRIQEVSTQRLGWRADETSPDGGYWDSQDSATTAVVRQSRSLYVPADRSGDWVEDYGESTELLEISGPDAGTAKNAVDQLEFGTRVEVYPGGLHGVTGVGAEGVDPADVHQFARNALSCYYDEMPRDPRALVEWLDNSSYEYLSECAPPQLGDPVGFNLAPADLRAAMFQALALVEGARVERVDGDITTIAFPEGGESDWMQTVDVDTAQGLIVGRGGLDDDRWSSRVYVTVVDAIPTFVPVP
ncbi:hypothetical protein [Microbacterium sp.]|uniref:hypothetical protein n=1 Tax=Microbacterium sp. TaxID=51671 RepID=UPI00281124BC|nr:hypothetical protein [Microbacterium sp.]